MSLHFGRWLKLDKTQLRQLVFLSYCHGLGKIGLPDAVLLNAGSLNEEDWAKVREYPEISALICNQLPVLREFAPLVRSHQERIDGTGYPDGLKGEKIPFIVQVFQLVNIADAIISKRLYRSRDGSATDRRYWLQAVEEITREMEAKARDPELCEKFFRFLELFYQGGT
ncbi:phosphohydrolase [Symplocastrum sp. BBK-W-15]|uniref:Phosphohydrolase n=2 Tax=Limnofasciculus TaxID=3064905 RepID=A0AAE3GZA2_9CYAN|nr:HD domain-containing phosphohydrolase [Limnofasciculus baicalensis]MCP2732548.1 phosphohydrolase [Limnofasciculus baicalensis BBK-W-15]